MNTFSNTNKIIAKCKIEEEWKHLGNNNFTVIKYSNGTFIKIGDILYLLSCYHGISKAYKISINIGGDNILLDIACKSNELDIALLNISKSLTTKNNFVGMDDFANKLPDINEKLFINTKNKISLNVENIIFEKLNNWP